MPLTNGVPHCVNHPSRAMNRVDGISSLQMMVPQGPGLPLLNTGAFVLSVYQCPDCRYVELYNNPPQ